MKRLALGFALGAALTLGTAVAQETERVRLYTVVRDFDLHVRWFDDGNAECYVATNDAGLSGIHSSVARGTSITCRWKVQP